MIESDWAEVLALPHVQRGMFILRIAQVDLSDPFHTDLVASLEACGPEATDGELVVAIRFVVGQHKESALIEQADAEVTARRMKRINARQYRAEGRVSQAVAERMVEETEEYWDLRRREKLAGARAQACTDLLFALQAATDTWRTSRADDRAADRWSARPMP